MAEKISIRVSDTLQGDCRIISLAFHPTEPFVAAGLANGDVCLCACRTDALTALVEHERANRSPEPSASSATQSNASDAFAYVGARAPAAGWRLLRVLHLPLQPPEVVQHVNFLSGREADLIQDLALPEAAAGAGGGPDALRCRGRHLALLVTNLNSAMVVDVMQNTVLRFWDAVSGKIWVADKTTGVLAEKDSVKEVNRDSPFHGQQMITQVRTFGALLFCVIAKRADVIAQNQRFHAHVSSGAKKLSESQAAAAAGSTGPAAKSSTRSAALEDASMEALSRSPELLYKGIQSHYLYVCHLGYTNPFAKPHKSQLGVGKGAYIITPKGKSHKQPLLFIRVHPLAPIVMTVTESSLRVYGLHGGVKAVPYAVLQRPVEFDLDNRSADAVAPLLDFAPSSSSSASGPSSGAAAASAATMITPWLLDADFLPTVVVASAATASSSASSLTLGNLSLAMLTSHRLSFVDCSFSSEDKRIHSHTGAGTTGAGRAGGGATSAPSVCYAPRERTYAVPVNGGLRYQRLYTWLGSPCTVLVQQSNRQLVEYTEGDVLPLVSRLLTVRSVRTLPRRCGYAWFLAASATRGDRAAGDLKSGSGARVCCCFVSRALRLPTWGLQDRLPAAHTGEVTAETSPLADAAGSHRVVFSSPTHIATWRSPANYAEGCAFHVASVVADTSSIDSSAICFTVALTESTPTTQARTSSSSQGRVLTVTRVVGTAPVALHTFEHSLYFVGSRAQASNVFVVGGLVYAEEASTVMQASTEDGAEDARLASIVRTTRTRAALFCCPAAPKVVQQAADAVAAASVKKSSASIAALQDTAIARYAGVHPVPVPSFGAVDGSVRADEKVLLSTSFQLTNDSQVVPCVWSLWAPPAGGKQLVLQRFSIAEDVATPMWSAPQLVTIQNKAYENPTQIFSLATVGGMRCTWPQESTILGQLFLFYEESRVLVLATVERGSRYVVSNSSYGRMLFASELSSADYGASADARPGMPGGRTDSSHHAHDNTRRADDGELHLVPQAAVELPGWGSTHGGGPVQLTATLSGDGNAVLVAVASRRHGFAIAEFPVVGRRSDATDGAGSPGSGVATLVKERVLCTKRWSALSSEQRSGAEETATEAAMRADEDEWAAADQQRTSPEMAQLSPGQRVVRLSQQREARDVRRAPRDEGWDEAVAPVALFHWIGLATGTEAIASAVPGYSTSLVGTGGVESNVVSFVLIQRFRQLFAVHPSGHITCLCPGINNCVPLGVCYSVTQSGTTSSEPHNASRQDREDDDGDDDDEEEQEAEASPTPQGPKPAVPPLPLGRLGVRPTSSATGAAESSVPVLRVAVQYGDYAGLLPHVERSRQRFTQSAFARRGAPQLTMEGADGVVAFVPGSATKQPKVRRSAARPPTAGANVEQTTETHQREVMHVMEQTSRRADITSMREDVYACVPVWVTAGTAALGAPSWTVVQDMDITDPLRAAVVRMHATDVARAITQLITSSVLLTASIRGTFAALRHELDASAQLITAGDGTSASLLGGDLPTAQVLATVPLSSVTVCLAHELCRAKTYDDSCERRTNKKGGKAVVAAADVEALKQSQLAVQRWWLLVMQSYVLVNALNDGERDRSAGAVNRVLTVAPDPFAPRAAGSPPLKPETVGEVLLYCPIVFHPSSLWTAVVSSLSDTQKKGPQTAAAFLEVAIRHALALLGGRAEATSGASWLQTMVASLALDGAHWMTSVLLDRLYYNIKGLADGSATNTSTTTSSNEATMTQLASAAQSLVAVMDSSSEVATAAAVVEVAASTVATLRGSGYSVSGASREKMAAAVAVSVSRRKKVLGVATPRALGGRGDLPTPRGPGADVGMSALLRRLDAVPPAASTPLTEDAQVDAQVDATAVQATPPIVPAAGSDAREERPQDVLLRPPGELNAADELRVLPDTALLAQLERIRTTVYATHWHALYELSAYDGLCWQPSHKAAAQPLQMTQDPASTSVPRRQTTGQGSAVTGGSGSGGGGGGKATAARDKAVKTAETTAASAPAEDTQPLSLPTRQLMEDGESEAIYAPPTPAQIQAMLASEEADMRTNYYDGFAAEPSMVTRTEDGEAAAAVGAQAANRASAEDELRDLQRRIAAPVSVSTRTRRTDGGANPTSTPTAPLRAEDFFQRMAETDKNESDVW